MASRKRMEGPWLRMALPVLSGSIIDLDSAST